jgi:hypothetical protein
MLIVSDKENVIILYEETLAVKQDLRYSLSITSLSFFAFTLN